MGDISLKPKCDQMFNVNFCYRNLSICHHDPSWRNCHEDRNRYGHQAPVSISYSSDNSHLAWLNFSGSILMDHACVLGKKNKQCNLDPAAGLSLTDLKSPSCACKPGVFQVMTRIFSRHHTHTYETGCKIGYEAHQLLPIPASCSKPKCSFCCGYTEGKFVRRSSSWVAQYFSECRHGSAPLKKAKHNVTIIPSASEPGFGTKCMALLAVFRRGRKGPVGWKVAAEL